MKKLAMAMRRYLLDRLAIETAIAMFGAGVMAAVMIAAMESERKYQAYLIARPAHLHTVQR